MERSLHTFQNRDWPEVDLSMGLPEIRKLRSKSWAEISSIVVELAASHKVCEPHSSSPLVVSDLAVRSLCQSLGLTDCLMLVGYLQSNMYTEPRTFRLMVYDAALSPLFAIVSSVFPTIVPIWAEI